MLARKADHYQVVHPQTRSQTSHLASGWLLTWLLGVYLCAITSPTPGLIFFFFGYCEIYIVTKDATTGIQARQLDLSTLSWTWYSVFINARSCRICTSKRLTKLDVLEMQGVATFAVRATVVGWILWDGYSKAWLGKSTEVVGVVLKLVLAAVLVWALCRRKRAEAKAKGELTD